jgi:hypothetical protein
MLISPTITRMINVWDLQAKPKFLMRMDVKRLAVVILSVKCINGVLLAQQIALQLNLAGLAKPTTAGIQVRDGSHVDVQ